MPDSAKLKKLKEARKEILSLQKKANKQFVEAEKNLNSALRELKAAVKNSTGDKKKHYAERLKQAVKFGIEGKKIMAAANISFRKNLNKIEKDIKNLTT